MNPQNDTFDQSEEKAAESSQSEKPRRAAGTQNHAGENNNNWRHGGCGTGTYKSWLAAKRRCSSPKDSYYKDYGGRGIRMCERWASSFANFIEDMGPRPKGLQLDRIDNSKGYEPGNCRWATGSENCNNRRNNRIITVHGVSHTLTEWSVLTKTSLQTLSSRWRAGWSPIEIVHGRS